jgi:hypothetical protein
VRAALVRVMVEDRRVSLWGGETATAVVRNAMRTAAARSPAWTRGGKKREACITRVAVGRGEQGGQEKRAQVRWSGPFEVKAGMAGEGWGRGAA